ncbi:hypothetical protein [Clostridium estertheticum]|uniref:hypothetical protein n=1 Tax=Clostridium estertheticum TaxID=238834 RepID=UPI001CF339FE|nr:hypothetical protein [Clostridium estertheticum]MCB2340752.1 hypothetical protein [Clostridium estertheticum]
MKNILNLIDVVEQSIIEYNIKKLMETVSLLVEEIFKILPQIDERYMKNINNIFQNTNVALTNKDYLLYQDILEFELKPILGNMAKN